MTVIDGTRLLLDSTVADICDRLRFEERPVGASLEGALYVQPSLQGNSVIVPNDGGEETPLNLELLFNALLENRHLLDR